LFIIKLLLLLLLLFIIKLNRFDIVAIASITPLPRHVSAVQDCPQPTDIKQLQRFLGLVSFYRRFLPAVARTLQPLMNLLKGSPKVLLWSPAADAAFTADKAALVAAVPLYHRALNAVLSLFFDASDSHVGDVLQQAVLETVVFFLKKPGTSAGPV
jgi:hypothetical protein